MVEYRFTVEKDRYPDVSGRAGELTIHWSEIGLSTLYGSLELVSEDQTYRERNCWLLDMSAQFVGMVHELIMYKDEVSSEVLGTSRLIQLTRVGVEVEIEVLHVGERVFGAKCDFNEFAKATGEFHCSVLRELFRRMPEFSVDMEFLRNFPDALLVSEMNEKS